MSELYFLIDEQMVKHSSFLPMFCRKPQVDDRRVLIGVILFNCKGLVWQNARKVYGRHRTLNSRWKRWNEKCNFAKMTVGVAAEHGKKDRDDRYHLSEGTSYHRQHSRENGGEAV